MALGHHQARMTAGASRRRGQESPAANRSELVGRISLGEKLCSKSRSDSAARRWKESRCWCFDIREGLSARIGARRIDSSLLPFAPIQAPLVAVFDPMRASRSQRGVSVLESSHTLTASSQSKRRGVSRARNSQHIQPLLVPGLGAETSMGRIGWEWLCLEAIDWGLPTNWTLCSACVAESQPMSHINKTESFAAVHAWHCKRRQQRVPSQVLNSDLHYYILGLGIRYSLEICRPYGAEKLGSS